MARRWQDTVGYYQIACWPNALLDKASRWPTDTNGSLIVQITAVTEATMIKKTYMWYHTFRLLFLKSINGLLSPKITALHYVHFPNFSGAAKWLGSEPRPGNKGVTPVHRHIINEYLEMTEFFSIESKPNYKPRDIFNPLTLQDESRNLRAAWILPWWHRENEWVDLLCLELILERFAAGTWEWFVLKQTIL